MRPRVYLCLNQICCLNHSKQVCMQVLPIRSCLHVIRVSSEMFLNTSSTMTHIALTFWWNIFSWQHFKTPPKMALVNSASPLSIIKVPMEPTKLISECISPIDIREICEAPHVNAPNSWPVLCVRCAFIIMSPPDGGHINQWHIHSFYFWLAWDILLVTIWLCYYHWTLGTDLWR